MRVSAATKRKLSSTEGQIGIGTLIIFIAMVLVAAVAASVLIQTSGVLQQDAMSTGKEASKEVSSNLQIQQIEGFRAKNTDSNLSSTIDALKLTIGLNAASEAVDLNQVILTISDGYITNDLVYAGNENTLRSIDSDGVIDSGAMGDYGLGNATRDRELLFDFLSQNDGEFVVNQRTYYIADKVRDDDNSFSVMNPVITSGDVIVIYVGTLSEVSDNQYRYLIDARVDNGVAQTTSQLDLSPRATVNLVMTPEAGASATADFTLPSTFGSKERVALY
ncbi:archaellin/type IV pilin N-terminal domain-containing protein [Methanolobus profundi]|uniref:Flagellin n=1 Tax=Methanolobus profundi TaxID=487685 RepID=A0A1I4PBY6_9EURY|nr:archaellin/type IV pilin N-terminal domain-containing protein [Methanolobus profundi]SFM24873.1 flagellin FlaB [Methanolobus profundi]